jgi:hypothetical protein
MPRLVDPHARLMVPIHELVGFPPTAVAVIESRRGMVTPRYVKVILANACLVTTMPATGAGATIYRR